MSTVGWPKLRSPMVCSTFHFLWAGALVYLILSILSNPHTQHLSSIRTHLTVLHPYNGLQDLRVQAAPVLLSNMFENSSSRFPTPNTALRRRPRRASFKSIQSPGNDPSRSTIQGPRGRLSEQTRRSHGGSCAAEERE